MLTVNKSSYQLSPMQQGMLFEHLKSEQPGVNIQQIICSLHETLNVLTFTQAWQRVIERHPVLRTSFDWQGLDESLQTVHPEVQLPLEQQDWRHLSASEQEHKLQAYLQADGECGFDLTKAPLMRLALFQLTESDYKLVWTFHHILLDGRSLLILLKEVFAFYEAFCQGEDLQLEQPRPDSDYIEWLQQQDFSKAEAFWKQTLRGFSAPTPLVVDRSARGGHSQELGYGQEQIQLSEAVTSALKSLAQEHELTLNTLINGAWALLLSRYSGEEDVVFGARACLRSALEGGESMVGLSINTLPLRVCVSPEQSVMSLLKELQSQWIALRDYEHIPLGQVQTWSDIAPGTSLFQSIVVFENYQLNFVLQEQGGSWEKREFELVEQTSFALAVAGYDGTELLLKIKYDRDLFEAERIEEILDQFQYLLMQVVEHPEERIANFSLVTPKSQLILPNPTQALCSKWDGAIHTRFSQNVQRVPQQPAIVDAQVSWNYAELEERTNLLANYLIAHKIQPQEIVAIYAHRSACLVWAMLGVLKAGAAFVILDPAYPASRLIDYLQISQPRAFLHITAAGELPKSLSEYLETLSCCCHLQLTQESIEVIRRQFSGYGNHQPGVEVEPDDLAYVPFTSGSTGKPKGILSTHRPLSHFLQWHCQTFGFNQSDRFSMLSGLSHDPLIRDIFTPLSLGATLCIPQQQDIETPGRLAEWMAEQKITVSHLTPPMGQLLTIYSSTSNPSQRYFFFGGDILTVRDVDSITNFAPFATCVNFYGATETPQAMGYFIVPKPEERSFSKQVIPVGKGIADVQLLILNSLQQLAGIGEMGEIYVRTPYLAKGYIGSEELTSDRFIINPFTNLPEDRLYKTGDLGRYLPSGDIEFLGRSDYQVKIRGFRIELAEIEALLNQYPNVPENVVIAREDEPGNKRLVAYIVAPSDRAPNTSELRQFLQKRLPDYMVPSAFVMLEAFPLTPNGKIDRRALPAPDLSHREAENTFVAPRTPTEEILSAIWGDILGVEVGVYDNFFELGGHSLNATQVLSRVRNALCVELPLRLLFEFPTLGAFSEHLEATRNQNQNQSLLPIQPIARDRAMPLSFAQQRLWFLDQLEGESAPYNIPMALRLNGVLNVTALEQAIAEIVRRHEALRTTFSNVNGSVVQVIASNIGVTLSAIDLQELPKVEQSAEVQRLANEDAQRSFDLSRGPLLCVTLLRLEPEENVLLVTMHHIVSDGWSMGIFSEELSSLYEALSQGKTSPLPELPIQYADFVGWQREWLQGEILETQLNYWKQHLSGSPPLLDLPIDRPRPAVQTFQGRAQSFQLNLDLTQRLKTLSQQSGTTLFMTLLAAFVTLLSRYSREEDVIVGSPIANRNRSEIDSLIGFFVNTLVLRTDVSGNPSFSDLLSRVRQVALDAYTYQDVPFEQVVEVLRPERNLSYNPLFQVMFVLQNTPSETLKLPGLTLTPLTIERGTAMFDLTLTMEQTEQGLSGDWEYNTDLFDPATITRMMGHFQTLLEAIVNNPQQRVSELSLLTANQQHQLLVEWNNTTVKYPQYDCINQLIEQQVQRTPEAIAVVWENQKLTYQELNTKANQIAHYLRSLGVQPEVKVGICVERCLEMIVGILAIIKAGGAYLPLDPAYPPERLEFMLSDAQVPVILTKSTLVETLPPHQAQVICLDTDKSIFTQQSSENPSHQTQPHNLAYIIYTSGSTGKPKGTMIEHRSLINAYLAWEDAYHLSSRTSSHLQMASFSFDVFSGDFVRTLCSGGKLVICPKDFLLDPKQLYTLMQQQKIDCAEFVPAVLRNLIQYLEPTNQNLGFMKLLVAGSDSWYLSEYQHIRSLCGDETRLINSYGVSEATIDTTYFETEIVDLSFDRLTPIGRPFANNQVYLLDDNMQPVPIGVPGELYIGGAGLARGYLNRPDLTEDKFIPHPFADYFPHNQDQRLYKTNDKARYLADGNIEFLGRLDNQVKIRGFRIELGEIEILVNQHPQVKESIVIVREDVLGDKRIVAYIVPQPEQQVSDQTLRDYLSLKLPNYFIPSAYVSLDALPLTPNGKLDRKALPVPEYNVAIDRNFVAPSTQTETVLADIWRLILGLERVSINNNFFDLGGHSLLIMQVIYRVYQAFGVELSIRSLFEAPTLAEFAEQIDTLVEATQQNVADRSILTPLQPVARNENLPLSSAQKRLWFLDRLEPDSSAYNIRVAYRLTGQLNVVALEQGLIEIVRRHEALRTTFASVNGEPIQVITQEINFSLPIVDLRNTPETDRQTEAQRLVTQEQERPFDLATGPLWRSQLLHLDPEEYLLLVTMHHSVSDGWSNDVFDQELTALYEAFCSGKLSPLPKLPIQYADFAHWQQQWLQSEEFKSQLDYWKQQLGGNLPVLELPTDRPRPPVQTYRGAEQFVVLSKTLTEALKALSLKERVTLFITLLAAFKTLLYRYSVQEEIIVGTPIAGRNRVETERLIGCFVNTLVLRTHFSGNPSFRELLGRVREVTLGAYDNQDLPLEMLVQELQPERNLSYNPLFQVMFILQNVSTIDLDLLDMTVNSLEVESKTSKFDLTVELKETSEGLKCCFRYNTDLFDAATITPMMGHFQTLLEGIVAAPEQCLSDLPILTETERHQLLVEWNDTQTDYPKDLGIHQLFEAQVERSPDAVAVVFEDQQLTYRELNCRANKIAHHLQTLGVCTEVLVGICVERSLEMIVGLLAILKAGGAYVPIDPAYPKERLVHLLSDSQALVLLTQENLLPRLPDHQAQVICLDTDWGVISAYSQENPVSGVQPESLAYVIYTSGSTGLPKGVAIEHKSIVNYLNGILERLDIGSSSNWAFVSTIAADLGHTVLFPSLCTGGCLHVVSQERASDPDAFADYFERHSIDYLKIVPSHFAALQTPSHPQRVLPRQRLILGGEASRYDWVESLQSQSPHCTILNHYGPTETTVGVLTYQVGNNLRNPKSAMLPLGRPIANTQIYILDRHLQPVPIGVPGELHIGGAGLARGYLNRPELTGEKFILNPFSDEPGARLYKTGDLVRYLPDGNIEFLGRIDNQVKIRGFRIELGEIEALLSQHSAVRETVVIAREDHPGDKRLVAYVIPHSDQVPAASELRSFLKEKLPDYMVPSAFVTLDAIPLTPNGKVDHRALPAPDWEQRDLEEIFVAPRTPIEEALADIWSQVLGVKQIGVKDNFFDLGGHSLLAVRLVAEIEKTINIKIPLAALFQLTTVEQMASFFQDENRSAGGSTQEQIIDSATATELFNDSSPEYFGFTTEEYRTLLAIVAGRKGKRPRQNSLMVAVREQGGKPPLFICASAVEEVFPLVKNLDKEQPVYLLESGLVVTGNVDSKIKALAAHHVKDILLIQPEPPYLLCGYSFGGVLIDEIAQQLLAKGKQVGLVVLLDRYGSHPIYNLYDKLVVFLTDHLHHLAPLSFGDKLRYIQENIKGQISKRLPKSTNGEESQPPYTPQAYPGKVILFCSIPNKHDSVPPDRQIPVISAKFTLLFFRRAGWDQRIKPDLEIITVPGDHISMQEEPHVKVLAEKLQFCLDKAVTKTE